MKRSISRMSGFGSDSCLVRVRFVFGSWPICVWVDSCLVLFG